MQAVSLKRDDFRDWCRNVSDSDLREVLEYLHPKVDFANWAIADLEYRERDSERRQQPHWTTVPMFWAVVATLFFSLAALVVSLLK